MRLHGGERTGGKGGRGRGWIDENNECETCVNRHILSFTEGNDLKLVNSVDLIDANHI